MPRRGVLALSTGGRGRANRDHSKTYSHEDTSELVSVPVSLTPLCCISWRVARFALLETTWR